MKKKLIMLAVGFSFFSFCVHSFAQYGGPTYPEADVLTAYTAADTVVSNGVVVAFTIADTTVSNGLNAKISLLDTNVFKYNQNNQAGLHTTNIFRGFQTKGVAPWPGAEQTIAADTTILVTNFIVGINSAADVTITNAPNISARSGNVNHMVKGIHNDGDYDITIRSTNTQADSGFCHDEDLILASGAFVQLLWHTNNSCWELATPPIDITVEDVTTIRMRNETGSTISRGQAVAQAGFDATRKLILIKPADADDPTARPCIGHAARDIANNKTKLVAVAGKIINVGETTNWAQNADLYLSTNPAVNLGMTETEPEGADVVSQVVAMNAYSNATAGQFLVQISGARPIGIQTNDFVLIDDSPTAGEYTRITAHGIEGRTAGEAKTDLSFMTDLSDDTTPTLGGNLDAAGYNATGYGDLSYTGQVYQVDIYTNTYTGTGVTWNLANGNLQKVILTNDVQIANPDNLRIGSYVLFVQQDGTGSRLSTYGSKWDWGDAGEPTLETTGGQGDIVTIIVLSTNTCHAAIGADGGFTP